MRAPGASRLDSVPVVRGYQQGCPGETEKGRSPKEERGRLAGRLLWNLLDFREAVSPPRGRAHSGGSWLPAASTLRAELGAEGGSDLWGPRWSRL